MKLGSRLKTVASFVEKGDIVADIGTDHAYLPIYLARQKIVSRALACDVHSGPYQAARQAVINANLADVIEVRFGDGITIIEPGEADVATIAGMGGTTIIDILSKRPETTVSLKGLILQPMNAAAILREWLVTHEWQIVDEELVVDEDRLYEVIYAKQGHSTMPEPILLDIGAKLWEKRHPMLKEHIENLIGQTNRALRGMENSESAETTPRYQEFKEKIAKLEAKLACL